MNDFFAVLPFAPDIQSTSQLKKIRAIFRRRYTNKQPLDGMLNLIVTAIYDGRKGPHNHRVRHINCGAPIDLIVTRIREAACGIVFLSDSQIRSVAATSFLGHPDEQPRIKVRFTPDEDGRACLTAAECDALDGIGRHPVESI